MYHMYCIYMHLVSRVTVDIDFSGIMSLKLHSHTIDVVIVGEQRKFVSTRQGYDCFPHLLLFDEVIFCLTEIQHSLFQ